MRSQGYAFQVELTYRAARRGLRIVEVPIVFRERRVGQSKMSSRIALEAFWRVPVRGWRCVTWPNGGGPAVAGPCAGRTAEGLLFAGPKL